MPLLVVYHNVSVSLVMSSSMVTMTLVLVSKMFSFNFHTFLIKLCVCVNLCACVLACVLIKKPTILANVKVKQIEHLFRYRYFRM